MTNNTINTDYKNNYLFNDDSKKDLFKTDEEVSAFSKDEFMQLFLTELKHQDPLEPMDTEKMLDQTMQLSTIEAQTKQTQTLEELNASMKAQSNYVYLNSVDKYIQTNLDTMLLGDDLGVIDFHSTSKISNGSLSITGPEGNVIKTLQLNNLPDGVNTVVWNGEGEDGTQYPAGNYEVSINAFDLEGQPIDIVPGKFKINSIKFVDGDVFADIGIDIDIPADEISEFFGA